MTCYAAEGPLHAQSALLNDDPTFSEFSTGGGLLLKRDDFQLRLANSRESRKESSTLVKRMYAWRGYKHDQERSIQLANEVTLQTYQGEEIFGTLTQ